MADFPHTVAAGPDADGGGCSPTTNCKRRGQRQPPPRKAHRHRKRHVPVGPAGVWFQNFQQSSTEGRPTKTTNSNDDRHLDHDDDDPEEEDQQYALHNLSRTLQRRTTHSDALASFSSPAWIAMQCDRGWVTPVLPSHLSMLERYLHLRPHVPSQFTMIPELIGNNKESSHSSSHPWFCKNLVVLVSNIHGSATANGWTVTLTDETGATITAWIQPDCIRKQLQTPSTRASMTDSWFRTGCVWWLQNTTLFLSPDSPETRSLSFLLLVSEDNVRQVWTPGDGDSLSDERYIRWIEQRSHVAVKGEYDRNDSTISSATPHRSVQDLSHSSHQCAKTVKTSTLLATRETPLDARDAPSRAQIPMPSFQLPSTQKTVPSTGQTEQASTVGSIPWSHHESQFAAFQCPSVVQDEAALDKHPPHQTTNVHGDKGSSDEKLYLESTASRPGSLSTHKHTQKSPDQRTPDRRVSNSDITSASRKKGTLSLLQRRRKMASRSKLWTGAFCLDFSDEDDDDDDALEKHHLHVLVGASQNKEVDNQSPQSKRSLFRHDALQELANILSSDDENDNDA